MTGRDIFTDYVLDRSGVVELRQFRNPLPLDSQLNERGYVADWPMGYTVDWDGGRTTLRVTGPTDQIDEGRHLLLTAGERSTSTYLPLATLNDPEFDLRGWVLECVEAGRNVLHPVETA